MSKTTTLFFFLLLSLSSQTRSEPKSTSLRLALTRNPPHFPTLFHHARTRSQKRTRPECLGSETNSSFAMPIKSGAYTGTGQYFVRVRVGTPAQTFLLVADTGSDLMWVDCRHRKSGSGVKKGIKRVFDADRSRSFRPISCASLSCKTALPSALTTCPVPTSPCAYDYGYSDGSSAQGFYANEKATITLSNGRNKKLKGLIVGCTSASVGSSFSQSDGVLGLGYSNISFALKATKLFDGKFSYCLVDHLSPRNSSSYLTFGPNRWLNILVAKQTELIINPLLEPLYAVGVVGISVSGEVLKIPQSVWSLEKGGGTIIDSGTSLTILTEPAYKVVVAALSRRLRGIPRVHIDPFDVCYNWTSVKDVRVPNLVIHFTGSARLEPPAKSYLIDVAKGVKCIGFVSAPWPSQSTIGNIMQQEHLWEFDLRNQWLRFHRSTCL